MLDGWRLALARRSMLRTNGRSMKHAAPLLLLLSLSCESEALTDTDTDTDSDTDTDTATPIAETLGTYALFSSHVLLELPMAGREASTSKSR